MSAAPRSMFRIRYRTIILLMVVGLISWSAFSYWKEYSENSARRARELLAPPLGVRCRVEFDATHGRPSLLGQIVQQSDRWIVLEVDPEDPSRPAPQFWLPREQVLLIEIFR